jgi:hypothetical protein
MSAFERFKNAWSVRFPSDPIPDLPCLRPGQLSCTAAGAVDTDGSPLYGTVYGSVDVSAVERSLQACNANIEHLHREIERQQFIANYLWNVLHGVNGAEDTSNLPSSANMSPAVSSPSLKHVKKKPAQRFADSRSSSLPFEKVPSFTDEAATYDESLDNPVPPQDPNSPVDGSASPLVHSASPASSTSQLTESELPSGSNRKMNDTKPVAVRKTSAPLLEQSSDKVKVDSDDERLNSLESKLSTSPALHESSLSTDVCSSPSAVRSGTKTAHRQKPVPTPRISVQKLASGGQLTAVQIDGIDTNASLTDTAASSDQGASESAQPAVARAESNPSPVPKTLPKARLEPSESSRRVGSVKDRVKVFDAVKLPGDATVGKDPSFSSKRQTRQRDDYEEAAPFRRDAADSDEGGTVSSDDEEPLYYNIMLMKEQMLNRAHTFYAKANKPGLRKTGDASAENPVQANPSGVQLLKARDAGKTRSRESSKILSCCSTAFSGTFSSLLECIFYMVYMCQSCAMPTDFKMS